LSFLGGANRSQHQVWIKEEGDAKSCLLQRTIIEL